MERHSLVWCKFFFYNLLLVSQTEKSVLSFNLGLIRLLPMQNSIESVECYQGLILLAILQWLNGLEVCPKSARYLPALF